jgi:hypothetical protein
MKLTVTCQICGTILTVIQKNTVTAEDIAEYEANTSCDVVTNGVQDGQQDIQATMTTS